MVLANIASNYTRVPTGQTASAIAGGGTIRVHGIVFTGTATAVATLLEHSTGTTIATINVIGGTSFELKTGFIAHKGLDITTDANVTCTVFHSPAGA